MNLLSERIQFVMKDAGIEQADLVEASGASYSVVGQWISGDIKSINLKFALGIERNLGYNHIWLMINEGRRRILATEEEKEASLIAEREGAMQKFLQLAALFEASTEGGRDLILTTAEHAPKRTAVSNIVGNKRK